MTTSPNTESSIVETNESIVRQLVDGFNRNDPSVIDELVAEDCVLHGAPPGPAREVWKTSFAQTHQTFNPMHTEITHLVAEGNHVTVYETTTATQSGPLLGFEPTGKNATATTMMMVEITDGQIVARWSVLDLLPALVQLGHLNPT